MPPTAGDQHHRGRGQADWRYLHSRLRLAITVALGAGVAVATGVAWAWKYSPLVGWDATAAAYSAWVWAVIAPMGSAETRAHARREDPGRAGADALVILACLASLVAVGVVLVSAGSSKGSTQDELAGLAAGSLAFSWVLVHTIFTLRYARIYESEGGGIDFHQQAAPRYIDFAYVAFTIGMTFQVSDTDIDTTKLRGAALRQALISYLFGAVILATVVNFIASISSGGG